MRPVQGRGKSMALLPGSEGRQKLEAKERLAEGTRSQQRKSPKPPFISCFGVPIGLLIFSGGHLLYITNHGECKNNTHCGKPALKSSSPTRHISLPSCHLSFIASHQSYFGRWGVSTKITYCRESGVLNLCKGKECVMAKKIISCVASPSRVSLLCEF